MSRLGAWDRGWRSLAVEPIWSRGARSRRAPAREDLNDDHPATAARTEMREWLWLTVTGSVSVTGGILWWRH